MRSFENYETSRLVQFGAGTALVGAIMVGAAQEAGAWDTTVSSRCEAIVPANETPNLIVDFKNTEAGIGRDMDVTIVNANGKVYAESKKVVPGEDRPIKISLGGMTVSDSAMARLTWTDKVTQGPDVDVARGKNGEPIVIAIRAESECEIPVVITPATTTTAKPPEAPTTTVAPATTTTTAEVATTTTTIAATTTSAASTTTTTPATTTTEAPVTTTTIEVPTLPKTGPAETGTEVGIGLGLILAGAALLKWAKRNRLNSVR